MIRRRAALKKINNLSDESIFIYDDEQRKALLESIKDILDVQITKMKNDKKR